MGQLMSLLKKIFRVKNFNPNFSPTITAAAIVPQLLVPLDYSKLGSEAKALDGQAKVEASSMVLASSSLFCAITKH